MVADSERLLGADHPDALAFRSNLAAACQSLGDVQRAIPLHEQVLAGRQRILGDDHPDTVALATDLAIVLQQLGHAEQEDRRWATDRV